MTLLTILVGLGLEYFLGSVDRLRNFTWFDQYGRWLESRCGRLQYWDGPAGVLMTLGIPVLVLALLINSLNAVSILLSVILAVVVFIYCIGSDLNSLMDSYIDALASGDEGSIQGIERQFDLSAEQRDATGLQIARALLVRSQDHIFGVIFWFIVLGAVGALLFCLTVRLKRSFNDIRGAFADAARNLHGVMVWPVSRLLAVGFALAGSLVDALEGWRTVTGRTMEISEKVVSESGFGAIQLRETEDVNENELRAVHLGHIQEIQALVNRALIIWLTILGLMTLSGILS